ncbi:MAG: thioesterase family protein [Propionibacteriaceae bacterium]|nr:thioesterase family protein [Propionibacteriaceae bacterium]
MFRFSCPLRWSDLDAQGHVNNAHIVDYMQEARVAFFRSGSTSGLLDSGIVVVGHQVEYLSAVEYSTDGVDIDLSVVSLGGSRFEVAYDVRQDSRPVARARTVLCPFDFERGRPARLGDADRQFLASVQAETPPMRAIPEVPLGGQGTVTDLFVRWSDHDSYAHVNNAKMYDYFQQARIEVTSQWDPTMARAGAGDSQYMWLVARQDVDYVAQLSHRLAPYAVRTAPVALGTSSMTLSVEVFDPQADTVFARGRTVLVCADRELRPVPLPDSIRERLAPHLAG